MTTKKLNTKCEIDREYRQAVYFLRTEIEEHGREDYLNVYNETLALYHLGLAHEAAICVKMKERYGFDMDAALAEELAQ